MIRGAVARPVAVLMVFAGLLVVGVQSYRRLPVDLLPSINYPNLTVITEYPEVPADDLARLVTQPLEERITGLAGVRQVVSRTREGASTVTVQYEWGTAMDFANLHLREAVDQVSNREDFPDGADRPLILRWDPGARPVAIMVLEGDDDMAEMTQFCEEVVKPALEQVDGISQAEVIGGREREILVRPDPDKLRLYGLTMADLRQSLALSNVSFPGGRVRKGPLHLPLRILGEFESLDDIRRTEIPTRRAGLITVGDVAEVLDTVKEPEGLTLIGGQEAVSLLVYKEVGANTIRATAEVDRILEVLRGQYPDFKSRFVYRDADFVQESFRGLTGSLLSGAALAFLVLFFFLREWRSPIVVSLSMPVSIVTAFAFMHAFGVNLNLMSLGGLSLAAGMLVDNSIVVLDNIKRHLAEDAPGASVAATCATATREVAMPVLASTLTTVAVFFPVIYVPGIAGEFFRDQAITVTIALLVSVATALLLQPTLSARMLKAGAEHPRGIFRLGDNLFEGAYRIYHTGLVKVMDRKGPFYAWLALGAGRGRGPVAGDPALVPARAQQRRLLPLPRAAQRHAAGGHRRGGGRRSGRRSWPPCPRWRRSSRRSARRSGRWPRSRTTPPPTRCGCGCCCTRPATAPSAWRASRTACGRGSRGSRAPSPPITTRASGCRRSSPAARRPSTWAWSPSTPGTPCRWPRSSCGACPACPDWSTWRWTACWATPAWRSASTARTPCGTGWTPTPWRASCRPACRAWSPPPSTRSSSASTSRCACRWSAGATSTACWPRRSGSARA
ncbi:MAG: efflux RND transporter permease subunit [bacterium]|nr:efflux RND transporter permease subunit [bacterium]